MTAVVDATRDNRDANATEVRRLDRSSYTPTKAQVTEEGYIRADAVVTRAGVFLYRNKDGTIRRELRHADDVFHEDSLKTMRMIHITDDHPSDRIVNSKNAKSLSIGFTGENIRRDGNNVIANLVISDMSAVRTVKDLGKRELSLGYTVDLIKEDGVYEGEAYDYRQKNIKYNHLSVVSRGRAGAMARIHLDAGDGVQIANDEGEIHMEEKLVSVHLDGIEYKASPEVGNALRKSGASMEDLKVKIDSLTAELEKTKAERDSMKERADKESEKGSEKEMGRRVKERVALINTAKKIVPADIKLDEMEEIEIKKAVVVARFPKASLEGKAKEYIDARFDTAVEDFEAAPADLSKKMVQVAVEKADASDEDGYLASKKRQDEDLANSWKGAK